MLASSRVDAGHKGSVLEIVPSAMPISEFCEQLNTHKILVDRRYQRSDRVWPEAAQAFLIESIILGYPVPKLFLHQQTDRISRKTVKFIVDGQQRSVAIQTFFNDELKLSKNFDLLDDAGKKYSELTPASQDRFLSYGIGIDLFVNTTVDEVREVFRRINSYEVPLNPEEQRHARWQGDFKWYVYHLAHDLDRVWPRVGTFAEKQLVRMQDMKLISEMSHALLSGVTTTNKASLDRLYRDYDNGFPFANEFADRISAAMEAVDEMEAIHGTVLAKPYMMYALVLAITHVETPVARFRGIAVGGHGLAAQRVREARLLDLAAAIDDGDQEGPFTSFVKASEKGTNVKAAREARIKEFVEALSRSSRSR